LQQQWEQYFNKLHKRQNWINKSNILKKTMTKNGKQQLKLKIQNIPKSELHYQTVLLMLSKTIQINNSVFINYSVKTISKKPYMHIFWSQQLKQKY